MKRVRLVSLISLVVLLHAAAFWWLGNFRPMPKRDAISEGKFEARQSETIDPQTGQKTIYREYTVTTKLSDPEPQP